MLRLKMGSPPRGTVSSSNYSPSAEPPTTFRKKGASAVMGNSSVQESSAAPCTLPCPELLIGACAQSEWKSQTPRPGMIGIMFGNLLSDFKFEYWIETCYVFITRLYFPGYNNGARTQCKTMDTLDRGMATRGSNIRIACRANHF